MLPFSRRWCRFLRRLLGRGEESIGWPSPALSSGRYQPPSLLSPHRSEKIGGSKLVNFRASLACVCLFLHVRARRRTRGIPSLPGVRPIAFALSDLSLFRANQPTPPSSLLRQPPNSTCFSSPLSASLSHPVWIEQLRTLVLPHTHSFETTLSPPLLVLFKTSIAHVLQSSTRKAKFSGALLYSGPFVA